MKSENMKLGMMSLYNLWMPWIILEGLADVTYIV